MRNLLTTLILGLFLAASATAAERENIFGIRMPESIDDAAAVAHEDTDANFRFMQWYSSYFFQGMHRYDDPRLGYSLGYATPGTDISVYVYDYGLPDIPTGMDSQLVRDELANSTNGIAQSGQYARVEQHVETEPLSPFFIQTQQTLTAANGQSIRSYVLLRAQNGYFVKVRITGEAGLERRAADFLQYIARDIGIENSGAPPAYEDQPEPAPN